MNLFGSKASAILLYAALRYGSLKNDGNFLPEQETDTDASHRKRRSSNILAWIEKFLFSIGARDEEHSDTRPVEEVIFLQEPCEGCT